MNKSRKILIANCIGVSFVCCLVVLVAGYCRSMLLLSLLSGLAVALVFICCIIIGLVGTTRSLLVGIAMVSFVLSIWTTDWPLRLTFLFAKPKLELLVEKHQNNLPIPNEYSAGTLRVKKIESNGSDLCFWTTYGFDQCGFVKRTGEAYTCGNLRLNIDLGDSWFFVVDD